MLAGVTATGNRALTEAMANIGSSPIAGKIAQKTNTMKQLAHLFQPNATDSVPPVKVRKANDDEYYSILGYTA